MSARRSSNRAGPGKVPAARELAVIGAGYVGLPLAAAFAEAGVVTVLVELEAGRVASVNGGESYVDDVSSERLAPLVEAGLLRATTDYDAVRETEAIAIALPTPLTPNREPDLSIVLGAAEKLASRLRPGHLVVLESTTYPGTTREQLRPILERSGLRAGEDFNLAFSPERVDPGRTDWTTRTTPKIVGGLTPACTERAAAFYGRALEAIVPVSSPDAAEMVKLLENIFRSVNIALVNELAQLCDRLGLDVWEIVDAASTKPFGFMRFEPGPGLGGHCLPVDPFYLAWKAREVDFYTEFVELAGKVNENMPHVCVEQIARVLNDAERPLRGSRVHLAGVAYKAGVGDTRESPALKLVELLRARGARVTYSDAYVPALPAHGLESLDLERAAAEADCLAIVTAHPGIDYPALAARAKACVDFRNATRRAQVPERDKSAAPDSARSQSRRGRRTTTDVRNHRVHGAEARTGAAARGSATP